MSVKPYVFDTSSFVRAWHEAYPIDIMHTFWDKLHDAITMGAVIAPDEVLRETSKRSDGLHKWLKERENHCIVAIDEELEDAVADLLEKTPRMAMNRKGASSADAWVVALAQNPERDGDQRRKHDRLTEAAEDSRRVSGGQREMREPPRLHARAEVAHLMIRRRGRVENAGGLQARAPATTALLAVRQTR